MVKKIGWDRGGSSFKGSAVGHIHYCHWYFFGLFVSFFLPMRPNTVNTNSIIMTNPNESKMNVPGGAGYLALRIDEMRNTTIIASGRE
jgi:hypothetical protein